jgi:hypothetical protein
VRVLEEAGKGEEKREEVQGERRYTGSRGFVL